MRRWLVVGILSSTAACSLIVGTDGLSGGSAAGVDGGAAPTDGPADTSTPPTSDATSDACVGSGCVAPPIPPCDGPCTPVLISMEIEVKGIAADESGVYWTAPDPGDIKRANVDGTGVTTLFDGNQAPGRLALDDTFVYWTEQNSGLVSAVRKDAVVGPRVTLLGGPDVQALAVSNGEVFFHVRSTSQVMKAPISLASASLVTTQSTGTVLRLAADAQFLYLGVTSGQTNRVRRAPRDVVTAMPADLTPKGTDFLDFVIDATRVYTATGSDGTVVSVNLDGTSSAITHTSGEANPSCVAVDDAYVYWGDSLDGLVRRTTKAAGGSIEVLAAGQVQPLAIAVNSRAIYWLNANGAVMTIRKP